ncbi:MAG: AMP-binding protein [Lentisphaerae bacterium]|jgi:acyl-CoA synthetase (AMP-forming)/AMP-acid ligase II|nr:AMP-binding protein [Lentisphaerota bacterium]
MNCTSSNNITSMLDQAAARFPDRPALVLGGTPISFRSLSREVNQCANLLTHLGLKRGERMIIMIPMSPELYIVMLAVIRCGAVAVFVDPWISMRQIAAFSAFAEPSGFIGIPKSHLLRLMNRKLAGLKITLSTGSVWLGLPARKSLKSRSDFPPDSESVPVAFDDPALITFTSGSSGIPKGANRTHGFLKAQYEALCRELDYRDDDIDMPMFPVFALRNLAAGITSVIPDMDFRNVAEVDPVQIDRQIREHGVTLITASPPFIDRLAGLDHPPQLRQIFTGGAPVTAAQIERWHNGFPKTRIDIIYGSTEAEPVAHLSTHERLALDHQEGFCCGKPTDLLRTRIVQIRKEPIAPDQLDALTLPQGETGELLVSGNHVCRDYFNNAAAVLENKVIEPDGTCWHRMGDTGYFDEEGRFFLTGRVHSTIMRNGKILHAQLIEAAVQKQVPNAQRVAALEQDGKLLIVIQGEPVEHSIDADRVIFTQNPLPLDPRHKSKIDYQALRILIQSGSIK